MKSISLKEAVLQANREIGHRGLAPLTWGNVSGMDRQLGVVWIKPSGVEYDELQLEDLIAVDLDGKVVEGKGRPSSDTATHVRLYHAFPNIGSVIHTHSPCATAFAQAMRELPCLGTTHADHFLGSVPLTRQLTAEELAEDYEGNTGKVIIERFKDANPPVDPISIPAVLVNQHAPFIWGKDVKEALKNATALESIAQMALHTFALNPTVSDLPEHLLAKHYMRKHGPNAYYGQSKG